MATKNVRRSRHVRGQSMVEYSMINWVLIVGLVLASTVRVIPGPKQDTAGGVAASVGRQPMNLIELFLTAYQTYYDSYYFVLNLPFP
jgi:hypothetical protein